MPLIDAFQSKSTSLSINKVAFFNPLSWDRVRKPDYSQNKKEPKAEDKVGNCIAREKVAGRDTGDDDDDLPSNLVFWIEAIHSTIRLTPIHNNKDF